MSTDLWLKQNWKSYEKFMFLQKSWIDKNLEIYFRISDLRFRQIFEIWDFWTRFPDFEILTKNLIFKTLKFWRKKNLEIWGFWRKICEYPILVAWILPSAVLGTRAARRSVFYGHGWMVVEDLFPLFMDESLCT